MDSPTELSDYTLRSFKVRNPDGTEFTIRTAVHHDGERRRGRRIRRGGREDRQRGGGGIRRISRLTTPGTYTFLGDYVPWGGGDGMEHRNSTVVTSATSFKNPRGGARGARDRVARVLPLLERRADPPEDARAVQLRRREHIR